MEKKPSKSPTVDAILDALVPKTRTIIPTTNNLALNLVILQHHHIRAYYTFLSPKLNNIYNDNGKKLSMRQLLFGADKEKWL